VVPAGPPKWLPSPPPLTFLMAECKHACHS
jgi:hypothetical protein